MHRFIGCTEVLSGNMEAERRCFMDSLHSMNQAMDYIEKNITEEIDYSAVSKIALCSEYHFKRMFSYQSEP